VYSFTSLQELLKCNVKPDIALLDYCLEPEKKNQGITGLDAAKGCSKKWPTAVLILMTSKTEREIIENSHTENSGIHDFYNKSTSLGALPRLLYSTYHVAIAKHALRNIQCIPEKILPRLAGKKLPEYVQTLSPLIQGEESLLIQGEVGTGKRTLIESLLCYIPKHISLTRLNCADAKPSELKAAFRALSSQCGKQEEYGWLILEEISFLTKQMQRTLENILSIQNFQLKERSSHIKVLATSSVDLNQQAALGNFSLGLISLLNCQVKIPPLRERPEEIEELIRYWLVRENPTSPRSIMTAALECLKSYPWRQGNVLELFQTLKAMLNIQSGNMLTSISLPKHIKSYSPSLISQTTLAKAPSISLDFDPTFSKPFDHYFFELLARLVSFVNLHYKTLGQTPSIRDLSRLLNVPRTTLKRYLTEVERLNLMSKEELHDIIH
jgi:DNA-binding NtrC family response regulator